MKSILIIGLGRFGRHMAAKFQALGNAVMAIEKDEERADNAIKIVKNIQIGDAANEDFMERIGVRDFDICVVAIGDDPLRALEITMLLKDFGAKYILARASRDIYRKLLLRNGADRVIYAERDMAERLAMIYGASNIFDYIELTPDTGIYEIAPPKRWWGKSIVELGIRNKYQVSILATKEGGSLTPLPEPTHVFQQYETLLVMGTADKIKVITEKIDR